AILYFDYAITFGAEVERFWKARFSPLSFVFYLNRYLSFFVHIPVIYEFYWAHTHSLHMYHQILAGVTQVIVAGLQIFRIHALYNEHRSITLFLFTFCVVGCVISGWSIAQTWQHPSLNHKYSRKDLPDIAVIWAIMLAFDLAVFALTISRIAVIGPKWRGSLFTLSSRW
ncbi:hypothetical protein LXA43DRAFT_896391, partial [Ganoderma leucocontextum]